MPSVQCHLCSFCCMATVRRAAGLFSFLFAAAVLLFSFNAYAIPGTVSVKEKSLDFVPEQSVEHVAVTEDYTWPWEVAGRTDWKLIERDAPSFGFSAKYHWFRMRIRNDSPDFSHIVASVDSAALDCVNFFVVDTRNNSLLLASYMGSSLQNESGISGRDFMMPLYLTDGQMVDLYIQVRSRSPLWVPISLRTGDEYSSEETLRKLVVGFISGGALLIFFYCIFMSLLVREKQFIFYGIFVLSILTMFIVTNGYTFAMSPLIEATSFGKAYCFLRMIMFSAMYFAGSFLFAQPFGRRLTAICRWYSIVPFILAFLFLMLPLRFDYYSSIIFLAVSLPFTMLAVNVSWQRQMFVHKLFSVFVILETAICLFFLLRISGMVHLNYTETLFNLNLVFLMSIVSVALVSKTYYEKKSRIQAAKRTEEDRARLKGMFQNSDEGMFVTSFDGRLLNANPAFYTILGFRDRRHFNEKTGGLVNSLYVDQRLRDSLIATLLSSPGEVKRQLEVYKSDGTRSFMLVTLRLRTQQTQNGKSMQVCDGVVYDVSPQRETESKIKHVSSHDPLTGAHNRVFFTRRVSEILSDYVHHSSDQAQSWICFIDLDHFKIINSAGGFETGDRFLVLIAKLLLEGGIAHDRFGRLGGDEFGVIVSGVYLDDIVAMAEHWRQLIAGATVESSGNSYTLSASIGLCPFDAVLNSGDDRKASLLLSISESACAMAKRLGRNRVFCYTALSSELRDYQDSVYMVSRVYEAINHHSFALVRQQIYRLGEKNDRVRFEVFVRMLDHSNHPVNAGRFLSTAVEFGLMVQIDGFVIDMLLDYCESHPERFENVDCIFINLSQNSILSQHMLLKLKTRLKYTSFPLSKLCFEIDNNIIQRRFDDAKEFFRMLRSFGCRLVIDHFDGNFSTFMLNGSDGIRFDFAKINLMMLLSLYSSANSMSSLVKVDVDTVRSDGVEVIGIHADTDESVRLSRILNLRSVEGSTLSPVEPLDAPFRLLDLSGDRQAARDYQSEAGFTE